MFDLSREPVIGRLPWLSAAEAESRLNSGDRRSLRSLRAIATEAWRPDALAPASLGLARFLHAPMGVVASGDPVPAGRRVGASRAGVADDDALWSRVRTGRAYDPSQIDEFTNRPVNTSTLGCRFPERAKTFHEIWGHLDVIYQLRTALAVNGEFCGYVGVWRPQRDGVFELSDHARMASVLPQITDLLVAARALRSVNGVGLAAALDAFDQCAFLLLGPTVVHVNLTARARYPVIPEWLRGLGRGEPGAVHAMARLTRIEVDGKAYTLAIPRFPPGDASPLAALPASLRRVAELMADGRSDKEIAMLTGYTLATSRTFATRVLERLGKTTRGELVRLVRGR